MTSGPVFVFTLAWSNSRYSLCVNATIMQRGIGKLLRGD